LLLAAKSLMVSVEDKFQVQASPIFEKGEERPFEQGFLTLLVILLFIRLGHVKRFRKKPNF
jgi:hypothetical protein